MNKYTHRNTDTDIYTEDEQIHSQKYRCRHPLLNKFNLYS